jgi:MtfA peptidase
MIFSWFRNRRRKRLAARPFPEEWDQWIQKNVAHVAGLSSEEDASLKAWIQIFAAEKYWEGCDGLAVTEEMQATISAQAGFMVRGMEDYYYDHLQTILVYPHVVWRADSFPEGGVVSEEPTGRLGEALRSGPVSLVWPHVLDAGRRADTGRNVVFHEFAHVLDWEDQYLDGTPRLHSAEMFQRWEQVIKTEYEALVNAARRGRSTLIDPYGATNIAEFFAVSTECFFEQPHLMSHRHPEWFALLGEFYQIDPYREFP